jgi:hypothetical protein
MKFCSLDIGYRKHINSYPLKNHFQIRIFPISNEYYKLELCSNNNGYNDH